MAGTTRPCATTSVTLLHAAAPPYALITLAASGSSSEARAAGGRRRAATTASGFMAAIIDQSGRRRRSYEGHAHTSGPVGGVVDGCLFHAGGADAASRRATAERGPAAGADHVPRRAALHGRHRRRAARRLHLPAFSRHAHRAQRRAGSHRNATVSAMAGHAESQAGAGRSGRTALRRLRR